MPSTTNSHNSFCTTYNDTKNWLDRLGVMHYYINPDTLEVDVSGDVNLRKNFLQSLRVKFNRVKGDFDCDFNDLSTLIGAPNEVKGNFKCAHNKLTTLEGSPQYVGDGFWCDNNVLTSLKGAPSHVGHNFTCCRNYLTSLEGAPKFAVDFVCTVNNLMTLEGCPPNLSGMLTCDGTATILLKINSFVKSVPYITLSNVPYTLYYFMWVFFIKSLQHIKLYAGTIEQQQVCRIINKHLQHGRSGPSCQIELIDAGLGKYTKIYKYPIGKNVK